MLKINIIYHFMLKRFASIIYSDKHSHLCKIVQTDNWREFGNEFLGVKSPGPEALWNVGFLFLQI